MAFTVTGGATSTYVNGNTSAQNPLPSITEVPVVVGGVTGTNILNEAIRYGTSPKTTTINHTISCSQQITGFTNNSPSICDISNFPLATYVNTGLGSVTLKTNSDSVLATFTSTLPVTVSGNYYLTGYVQNSLANTINSLIIQAVAGRTTPDPSFMNVYTSGTYTFNPNLYTKNIIDLSPFTDNGYYYGCCLISPRHVTAPTHANISVGQVITFNRPDGTTTTKTVTNVLRDVGGAGSDIGLGYLDSEVTGITPYSVLPPYAKTVTKLPLGSYYFSGSTNSTPYDPLKVGILGFWAKLRNAFGGGDARQMQLGICMNLVGSPPNANVFNPSGNAVANNSDVRYPYSTWWTTVGVGDSGSPVLIPTGLRTATGTPLTILSGHTYMPSTGPAYAYFVQDINAAMNAMKDPNDILNYALDDISVSHKTWWDSFNSY